MGETTWTSYAQAATTAISTDMNSDAHNAYAISSAIDNSSNLDLFMDVELYLASVDLSAQTDPAIYIWVITRFDGTNFSDGDVTDGVGRMPDAIISLNEGSAAETKREVARRIEIPPEQFKILYQNKTGASLASSGNTIKYRTYGVTTA